MRTVDTMALNLRPFPRRLWKALRIRAAEEDTSILALVIKYVEQGLDAEIHQAHWEQYKKGRK